jgi:hypothetical protein
VHKVTPKNRVFVEILLSMYCPDVHRVMRNGRHSFIDTVDRVAVAWTSFVARVVSAERYYFARATFNYYNSVLSCDL